MIPELSLHSKSPLDTLESITKIGDVDLMNHSVGYDEQVAFSNKYKGGVPLYSVMNKCTESGQGRGSHGIEPILTEYLRRGRIDSKEIAGIRLGALHPSLSEESRKRLSDLLAEAIGDGCLTTVGVGASTGMIVLRGGFTNHA